MKTLSQKHIAEFVGVSPNFISLYRRGDRLFSKQRAKEISLETGIPFDTLAFRNGEKAYRALVFACQQQKGGN